MTSKTVMNLSATRRLSSIARGSLRSPADMYSRGSQLSLQIASGATLEVKVVKAFTPFTFSACLLVENLHGHSSIPEKSILKLADYRIGHRIDDDEPWDDDQGQLLSTGIQEYLEHFGHLPDFGTEPYTDYDTWQDELCLWTTRRQHHQAEILAYHHLRDMQGFTIPRFYGEVSINIRETDRPSIHPAVDSISGILLEYIPGRSLDELKVDKDISMSDAETVSQKVLDLCRRFRRYQVLHGDLHRGNIILRHHSNEPVVIDWGHSTIIDLSTSLEDRWSRGKENWNRNPRYALERSSDPSQVWHRRVTPFSNGQWEMIASNHGYEQANTFIEWHITKRYSTEDIHEAVDIDPKLGMRWRVKAGVKVRFDDDHVPQDMC